jgi:hypothetical protein
MPPMLTMPPTIDHHRHHHDRASTSSASTRTAAPACVRRPSDRHHVAVDDEVGGLLWQAEQVENPFEASFLLLADIPYIQPLADGNKRSGRLACNIPLLKAAVSPMSFISLDKADYLAGLILFYETRELNLLAELVADGYAAAAPSYAAAVAVGRQPRSVQLRKRQGI